MNIKVCGITQLKQIIQLDALDLDFVGLHFYKRSSRYMADQITAKQLAAADFDIKKTGVFYDQDYEEILDSLEDYELDVVQLNGNEPVSLCKKLAKATEIIKTFYIDEKEQDALEEKLKEYDEVCDYYMFDSINNKDLSGECNSRFDWQILMALKIEKPFFIAGSIGLEDAMLLKKFKHPDFFGIDLHAGFETAPGVKDLTKVLLFKKMLH